MLCNPLPECTGSQTPEDFAQTGENPCQYTPWCTEGQVSTSEAPCHDIPECSDVNNYYRPTEGTEDPDTRLIPCVPCDTASCPCGEEHWALFAGVTITSADQMYRPQFDSCEPIPHCDEEHSPDAETGASTHYRPTDGSGVLTDHGIIDCTPIPNCPGGAL